MISSSFDMSSILLRLIDSVNFQKGLFTRSIDALASDSSWAAGDTLVVDFYIETAIGGTAASAVTA